MENNHKNNFIFILLIFDFLKIIFMTLLSNNSSKLESTFGSISFDASYYLSGVKLKVDRDKEIFRWAEYI